MTERSLPNRPSGGTPERHLPWRLAGWGLAGALLLAPLVAMQFTDEVQWTMGDFFVFGLMLGTAGALLELAVRNGGNGAYRLGVALTVFGAFLLLWINLAVGIIGSEENPANLLFGTIFAVLFVGALLSRGQAAGLARTLYGAAVVQLAIALLAAVLGLGNIFLISAVFTLIWLLAAGSFRKSAGKLNAAVS